MLYPHPYNKYVPKTYLVEHLKPITNKLIISRKNFELFQDFFLAGRKEAFCSKKMLNNRRG